MTIRKKVVYLLSFLFILVTGFFYCCSPERKTTETLKHVDSNPLLSEQEEITKESTIYVHISGAVVTEGIYQVAEGSRLFEVIEFAGGLLESAATQYVNMAQIVADGKQYYVPTVEETKDQEISLITAKEESTNEEEDISIVNINTASISEFCNLPGIGKSKAENIVKYRDLNGCFRKIEDIRNVKGIGDALFEKMKPYLVL